MCLHATTNKHTIIHLHFFPVIYSFFSPPFFCAYNISRKFEKEIKILAQTRALPVKERMKNWGERKRDREKATREREVK